MSGDHASAPPEIDLRDTARRAARHEWAFEPTALALSASSWRHDRKHKGEDVDPAFCTELGRRLLLAELEFSEWVLRRVEKVDFVRDRTVSRRISIELRVRDDAPVFRHDGKRYWLVPLSTMGRRNLINLDLRDERGRSVLIPGIRLTQQLDQSILRAAAAAGGHPVTDELLRFIQTVVTGRRAEVRAEMDRFHAPPGQVPCFLRPWVDNHTFRAALERLHPNFTLYVFLPVAEGKHRLLRMSFDEPMNWAYSLPRLEPDPCDPKTLVYTPIDKLLRFFRPQRFLTALGMTARRVRLQVPGAENAAGYHFEASAPHGVRIVKASLLAGRPNDPDRYVGYDRLVGHAPTVGLHVVEVPNGSLCRVQLELRVTSRGWLTTMLISCWAIFLVLLSVGLHESGQLPKDEQQVTNVILLLITVSAGVATLIAQRDTGGVAARMLTPLRALAALNTSLPVIAAGFLVYAILDTHDWQRQLRRVSLWSMTWLSFAIAVTALLAWLRTWWDERESGTLKSPWDVAINATDKELRTDFSRTFTDTIHELRFDKAAMGIRSAEGWHWRYSWTDEVQKETTGALHRLGTDLGDPANAVACHKLDTACGQSTGCPVRKSDRTRATVGGS